MKEKSFMNQEANHWLARAKSNLEFAKDVRRGNFTFNGGYIFIEEVCYELQQSVEKALKALFIFYQIKIPYTHNIAALITGLVETGINIPDNIKLAKKLTDYAVETRYPHIEEPLTEDDFNDALEIAQNVYKWAENQLN